MKQNQQINRLQQKYNEESSDVQACLYQSHWPSVPSPLTSKSYLCCSPSINKLTWLFLSVQFQRKKCSCNNIFKDWCHFLPPSCLSLVGRLLESSHIWLCTLRPVLVALPELWALQLLRVASPATGRCLLASSLKVCVARISWPLPLALTSPPQSPTWLTDFLLSYMFGIYLLIAKGY